MIDRPSITKRIRSEAVSNNEDQNGWLDPGQSIVDWAIRERGYSFADFLDPQEDPVFLLKQWLKLYRKSAATSIGCTIAGALGLGVGVTIGAPVLMGAGAIAALISGLNIKHHKAGEESCVEEIRVLEENSKIVEFLAIAEQKKMSRQQILSLYSGFLQRAIASPAWASNPQQVQQYFLESFHKIDTMHSMTSVLKNGSVDFEGYSGTSYDRYHAVGGAEQSKQPALPAVGNNTRFNAVSTHASEVNDDPWGQTPAGTPQSAAQGENGQLFVNGQVNPQILAMSVKERALLIIDLLEKSGCPIRPLIGRPTLASGGLQRSGKTTLILLVGILEKALSGQKLFYISRDNDLYPIAFDGYANGSTENAHKALYSLNKTINSGGMGTMMGQTWILDEFSTIAQKLPKPKQEEFWGMALTGFAKQGGRVRFMVHHKTAKANGLPDGQAETFKAEVKMLWTDRIELEGGEYIPSGNYVLMGEVKGYYRETDEKFTTPDWLKFDVNPAWHNAPCPVRSMLRFFPEFDTRCGAKAINLLNAGAATTMPKPMQPIAQAEDDEEEIYHAEEREVPMELTDPFAELEEPELSVQTQTLIARLQTSKDKRAGLFIDVLSTLVPGSIVSNLEVDNQCLQIALNAKVLAKTEDGKFEVLPSLKQKQGSASIGAKK